MKTIYTVFLLLLFPLFSIGQIKVSTIRFKDIPIECYKYKIEKDTIIWAYIEEGARKTLKKIKTNIGKLTTDATLDSISDFTRKQFPNKIVNIGKAKNKSSLVEFTPTTIFSDEIFSKVYNHFWIGAINYYSNLIETNLTSDTIYFKLAEALIKYNGMSMPWNINDRAISYLDSSTKLNISYTPAYLLKAKLHLANATWKGKLSADPHVDVIDPVELNKSTQTIKYLLAKGENKEAQLILKEINNLKRRYNQYKYE